MELPKDHERNDKEARAANLNIFFGSCFVFSQHGRVLMGLKSPLSFSVLGFML